MPQNDPRKRSLGGAAAPAAPGGAQQPATPLQSTTAQQPTQPQQAQQQQPGTGFVNLQRVLEANRQGAQQMGNQLASQVRQQGQQAQQGIQQGQAAYTAATAAKVLKYDPAGNQILGAAPTTSVRGDHRLADMERRAVEASRLAGASYDGPKDWESANINVPALTAQVAKANDAANAVATAGGRAALLRQQNPSMTAGGASLDGFLAGQGMGAQAQELKGSFGGLSDMLKSAREQGGEAYRSAEAETKKAAEEYARLADTYRSDMEAERLRQHRVGNAAGQERRRTDADATLLDDNQWTQEEQWAAEDRRRRGADRYERLD